MFVLLRCNSIDFYKISLFICKIQFLQQHFLNCNQVHYEKFALLDPTGSIQNKPKAGLPGLEQKSLKRNRPG